jgi:hypothetical protein
MKLYMIIDAVLAIAILCIFTLPVAAGLSTPTGIFGYVKLDGYPAGGAIVVLSGGQSATADSNGYFIFSSGVENGSTYTITASYNDLSTASTFTAHGDRMQIDLNISTLTTAHTSGTASYAVQPSPDSKTESNTNETPNDTSIDKQQVNGEPTVQVQEANGNESSGHSLSASEEENSGEEEGTNISGYLSPIQFFAGLAILGVLAGIGYYLLWRER